MTHPAPAKTLAPSPRLHFPIILLALALAFFAWRAYDFFVPTFFGLADEHGYLTTAKRLVDHGSFALHQPDPYAFIGETYMQTPSDYQTYYLRQPLGYPILCALAYAASGPTGPFAANPLLALAVIAGAYILGRQLKNPLAGSLAALFLACHPMLLYYSIKPLSHIPDMAAALWTIIAALTWKRDRKLWQAALIGFLLGMAILIRYTNILLALPLLIVLFSARKSNPKSSLLSSIAIASAVTALALIALLVYQHFAFGAWFRTGYSAGGNASSFSLAYLLAHARPMLSCLLDPGTGLSLLLAGLLIGIIILALRDRFTLALLLAWAIPPLLVNTAYYGMPRANPLLYARFALASFLPLILLALCWQSHIAGLAKLKPLTHLATALALAATLWSFFDPVMTSTLDDTRNLCRYVLLTSHLAHETAPPGSIILVDNRALYFMDYIDSYTIYSADLFEPAQIQKRLTDLDQLPHEFDPARTRQIADLLAGKTEDEINQTLRKQFTSYLAIGRPVYLLASDKRKDPQHESEKEKWQRRLAPMSLTRLNYIPDLQVGLYQLSPTPR